MPPVYQLPQQYSIDNGNIYMEKPPQLHSSAIAALLVSYHRTFAGMQRHEEGSAGPAKVLTAGLG